MSGVTLSDLSKYHQGAVKWFKDGLVSEQNRLFAQTEDAGAVSFWPLGGTPLEGKVKFSFKETPPASGDKGPSNPSTITGVSAITCKRAGKNLAPVTNNPSISGYGITFTVLDDGGYRITGTPSSNNHYTIVSDYSYVIPANTTLKVSLKSTSPNNYIQYQAWPRTGRAVFNVAAGVSVTVAASEKQRFILIRITVINGAGFIDTVVYPQIELGSSEIEFEKPEVAEATLSLGSTYYGGEIDLATGVMTVTRLGITLDGTENWGNFRSLRGAEGYRAQMVVPAGRDNSNVGFVCTHYSAMRSVSENVSGEGAFIAVTPDLVLFTNYTTLAELKAWLANQKANGTPVCVTWNIPTPLTVQLDPLQLTALTQKDKYTPRMNTVYTDADSIQIRYRKSLIHDEDEKVQAIAALGGNV